MDDDIVIYSPGKGSSYGHGMVPRSLPKAWAKLLNFLSSYTTDLSSDFARLSILFSSPSNLIGSFGKCVDAFHKAFGTSAELSALEEYRAGKIEGFYQVEWVLSLDKIEYAVDLILRSLPWSDSIAGGIFLCVEYKFFWKPDFVPNDKSLWARLPGCPADGFKSSFLVQLRRTGFIQPSLVIPYSSKDKRAPALLAEIAAKLPFKIATKHFRTVRMRAVGDVHRRLSAETAAIFEAAIIGKNPGGSN